MADQPKVEKVVTAPVIKKNKSWIDRFASTFFQEKDAKSVGDFVVQEILIPAARAMLFDIVRTATDRIKGGFEDLLFNGGRAPSSSNSVPGRPTVVVPYNKLYDRNRPSQTSYHERPRSHHDFTQYLFQTQGDAQAVFDKMFAVLEEYGLVTVSVFFELIEQPDTYVDNKYGWKNLSQTRIVRVQGGWIIDLPEPKPLD